MDLLWWILLSGVLMVAVALSGAVLLLLPERAFRRLLLPLVGFAAGALLGGAFFHMIPAAVARAPGDATVFLWVVAGFTLFFALEQFLHWHHCARAEADCRDPMNFLILIGDGVHNFIGGLGVAGVFLFDVRLGIAAWLAAAAHEIPQEMGDFAVLVHGGWSKGKALLFNVLSATTFLLGGLIVWASSARLDVAFLVPFAAGNFIYIAAADLVPEVKRHGDTSGRVLEFIFFVAGAALLWAVRLAFSEAA